MINLYFEELEIGTRSVAGPYRVSRDEIIQFARQYDPVPRHIDEEAAARSVFGLAAQMFRQLSLVQKTCRVRCFDGRP
jgi:acyl dehydratase